MDQSKKTMRHFYCRDVLWETFEQMANDFDCSIDYLVNEAMRYYARSKNYQSPGGPPVTQGAPAVNPGINNTGGPPGGPLLEATPHAFLETFGRHVLAAHGLAQLLVPGMKEQGYGRIVNVISTSVREPISGLGVSNTIRGAMASWAKTLANEVGPNITVNNVLPGSTDTERLEGLADARAAKTGKTREQVYKEYESVIPEGRLAEPEEIAAAIAFLASPDAAYIRGVSLQVDGGRMKSI